MKELKFRAFIADYGEDLENKVIYIDNLKVYGSITYTYDSETEYEYQIDTEHIMQYTGLKDRNGKEIYEGYLIQYSGNSRVWEVHFDEGRLQYRIRCTGKDGFVSSYSMDGLDCYVVGNIYENSDLINN